MAMNLALATDGLDVLRDFSRTSEGGAAWPVPSDSW
jgi:hypothetical protein